MRMSRESKEKQADVFVFTGDGTTEVKHVSALCKRLDGETKLLWFPSVPPGQKGKVTGLHRLMVLRQLVIQDGLSRLLFLVDREYFPALTRPRGQELDKARYFLEKRVRTRIEDVSDLLPRRVFLFRGSFGSKPFELCIVVRGEHLNADEEIAQLIWLKLGIQVAADKQKIDLALKKRKTDVEELIRNCSMEHLEQAFSGLYCALRWVEGGQ